MTPEAQRIALAEACGWTRFKAATAWPVWSNGITKASIHTGTLPDYLNDLNAIHDAEKLLTHDQWRIYLGFLDKRRVIPKLMSMEDFHACWNATAAQRCKALLRTLGLWRDDAPAQPQTSTPTPP